MAFWGQKSRNIHLIFIAIFKLLVSEREVLGSNKVCFCQFSRLLCLLTVGVVQWLSTSETAYIANYRGSPLYA